MDEITKRVKKEHDRLEKLFEVLEDSKKRKLADKLIDNASYLAVQLEDLRAYNMEHRSQGSISKW